MDGPYTGSTQSRVGGKKGKPSAHVCSPSWCPGLLTVRTVCFAQRVLAQKSKSGHRIRGAMIRGLCGQRDGALEPE